MSNQINDGGSAFPHKRQVRCNGEVIDYEMESGISIKDYFAAAETLDDLEDLNMAGAVALAGPKPDGNWSTNPIEWLKWEAKWRAELRFIRADAMIKARGVHQ